MTKSKLQHDGAPQGFHNNANFTEALFSSIKLLARAAAYAFAIGLALILFGQLSQALQLDHNEGLLEWLQFALIVGGAALLSMRQDPRRRWLRYLVVGGLFILAMEEIDWAQPYLGYTPLSILADNNKYGEMALHNAFGMEEYLRTLVLLCLMAGGGVLLIQVALKRGLTGLINYAQNKLLWPGALFAAGIITMLAGRLLHPGEFFSFDELGELAIYAGVIWFTLSRPLDILNPRGD